MATVTVQDIERLLEQIFIFDAAHHRSLEEKVSGLSVDKLIPLQKVLEEVVEFQKEILAKKIAADPTFYDRVLAKKEEIDRETLRLHTAELAKEDEVKKQLILSKIKSL